MTYMDPFPQGTRVSQPFGSSPNNGVNPSGGHTGRDYAVDVGTPVRAAADGTIRHSSWFAGQYNENPWWLTQMGGDTLVLDCGDDAATFVYAHLRDSTAKVGERVAKGQIIGYSGNSGTATTGPHCHVEELPPGWDWNNGTFGRIDPQFTEYHGSIAAQGTIKQEDELSQAQYETLLAEIKASRTVDQQIEDVTRAMIEKVAASVWAYTNPTLGGGDAYQILRDAVVNTNKLAADVAKVAAKAATGGATEAQITAAVKKAISESIVNVDVTVGGK